MTRPCSLLSLTGLFALLAYLSVFAGSLNHIADDPGIGWHLQNGEQIAQSREIPYVDQFLARARVENSFAPVGEGRAWVSDQWLSDLIFHGLFRAGGWPALYALVAGLFLIAYFGIAADGLRRAGQGSVIVLLAVVCALKMGQVHMIVRPVIFSLVLFPYVLRRVDTLVGRSDVSWKEIRRESFLLIPLFILWANLHPAFVYGLLVIAIGVIAKLIRDIRGGVRIGVLLLTCSLSTLVNPYGFTLHGSIVQLGGSDYLRSMTIEWSGVDLSSPEGILLLILSGIPLCAFMISRDVRRRVGGFEILVASVFLIQALWAVRILPFASFACLPLWAACFGSLRIVPSSSCAMLTSRVFSAATERECRLVAPGLLASCTLAMVGAIVMVASPARVLPQELAPSLEIRLAKIFEQVHVNHASGVIFASLNWGGAITHLLGERFKPVLDDRTVLVGEVLYRAYGQSLHNPNVFEDLVKVFGVTHAFVPTAVPLERYLASNGSWTQIYSGEEVVVFAALP